MEQSKPSPILRHLDRMHYDSAEWHRDAGIKQRGLGVREVDDPNVSNQKQDRLPDYGK